MNANKMPKLRHLSLYEIDTDARNWSLLDSEQYSHADVALGFWTVPPAADAYDCRYAPQVWPDGGSKTEISREEQ
jgi:hypothetical protein